MDSDLQVRVRQGMLSLHKFDSPNLSNEYILCLANLEHVERLLLSSQCFSCVFVDNASHLASFARANGQAWWVVLHPGSRWDEGLPLVRPTLLLRHLSEVEEMGRGVADRDPSLASFLA